MDALDGTAIFGLTTNLGFLRNLVASDRFARAAIYTSWLDEQPAGEAPDFHFPLMAAALFLFEQARQWGHNDAFGPDGWRAGGRPAPMRLSLVTDEQRHELALQAGADGQDGCVVVHGLVPPVEVGSVNLEGDRLTVEVEGTVERFTVTTETGAAPAAVLVAYRGANFRFELGVSRRHQRAVDDDVVVAPLPGTLVAVGVSAGDSVGEGQVLGVLESMKMEYPLKARLAARVERVGFAAGSRVARGDVLFELSEEISEGGQDAP